MLQGLIDGLFVQLLPGDGRWPPYSFALTQAFWQGWYAHAPALTRWGLVGCVVLLRAHGLWLALRGQRDREAQLQAAQASRVLVVQQALAVAKAVASLAYFGHPSTQDLARARGAL